VLWITNSEFIYCPSLPLFIPWQRTKEDHSIEGSAFLKIGLTRNLDIIRKMQGEYLRFERKYDKWGAMGKVLVVQELIRGGSIASMSYDEIRRYIYAAFPREFPCTKKKREPDDKSIIDYYSSIKDALVQQEMEEQKVQSVAVEETAESFCIETERIRRLVLN
jgi:hypothetical protein